MDTNSIYIFIDAIIGLGGLYILYLTLTMMKTGQLKENALMPKETDVSKCKDTAGYIRFMGSKQMVFGVLAVVCGVIGLIHDYTGMVDTYVYLTCIIVIVAYMIYYSVQSKKAMKQFW